MKAKWVFFLFSLCTFLLLACTNPFVAKVLEEETPRPVTPLAVTYTVAFESNGGCTVEDQIVTKGEKASRPDNPTKDGYGFMNWFDNKELAEPHYNFNTPVSGDITLYAKWSQTFYTVIFMDGESEIDNQTVGKGGTASRPVPTKDGYGFVNWYSDPDLTALYDFETPVTGGITLYAEWIPVYTVAFMDGDTPLTAFTKTVAHGSTLNRPETDPERNDYIFHNWYADGELTTLFAFDTSVTEHTSVYAGWSGEEFAPGTLINNIFNAADESEWAAAISDIKDGGDDKNYVIEVQSDFSVTGGNAATFGDVSGVTVSLRGVAYQGYVYQGYGATDATYQGYDRTLTLSGNGSILRTESDQNIITRNLTLRGHGSNYSSLVYMNGGTFTMYGGEISGNTAGNSGGGVYLFGGTFTMHGGAISGNTSSSSGGGVYVYSGGTFIMHGGEISGNRASSFGGGVYVDGGTFTMHGGEISGNRASSFGGGVYVDGYIRYGSTVGGTFRIVTGTIYGSLEAENVKNTAGAVGTATLYRDKGTVQYGTFIEGTWSSNNGFTGSYCDDTIRVINGVLIPNFTRVSADGSPELTTTALTLTFSQTFPGLSADDITLSGVDGVTKGQLEARGSSYILPISGFNESGTLSVSVSVHGYTVDGSPQTVDIYYIPFIEMELISAGTFLMGSPESEPGHFQKDYLGYPFTNEIQHSVTLTKGFYMGKYPVTQAQYQAVMGNNPSGFRVGGLRASDLGGITDTANFPVERVGWYDAIVFCNKLSILEGLTPAYRISGSTDPAEWGDVPTNYNATWNAVETASGSNGYRLPTEAQWEYACRAGTITAYNTGPAISDDTGWYGDNSGGYYGRTYEVGLKPPNKWGLYDMHGNVREWCRDWYGEDYGSKAQTDPTGPEYSQQNWQKVLRGGSFATSDAALRSASRHRVAPYSYDDDSIGFRVVRPSE